MDGLDDPGRGGLAEQRSGEGGGLVPGQPGQADLLGLAGGEQPGPPLAHRQARVQLVAAVGAGDQQRPAGQPGRQVGHHLQAQLVGPVEVLEHDQHRVPTADPPGRIGQVLDQQPPLPVPVAADPGELPQPPGHGLADPPQPGRPGLAQVAGQVQQQPPGGLDVAGEGGRPDHPERPPAGGLGDGGQQAGLADPGLAGHEQQVPSPGGGLGQAPVGQGQEVVAAHQDRRLQRAMTGQPCLPE